MKMKIKMIRGAVIGGGKSARTGEKVSVEEKDGRLLCNLGLAVREGGPAVKESLTTRVK